MKHLLANCPSYLLVAIPFLCVAGWGLLKLSAMLTDLGL